MALSVQSLIQAATAWSYANAVVNEAAPAMPDLVGASIHQAIHEQAARLLVASVVVPESTRSPQDALKVLFDVSVEPIFQGHAPRDLDALVGLLLLRALHVPVLATVIFVAPAEGSTADWEAVYVLFLSNSPQLALAVDMTDGSGRSGPDLESAAASYFPRIKEADNREIAVFQVESRAETPAAPTPTPVAAAAKAPVPKKKKRPTPAEESVPEKTNVG